MTKTHPTRRTASCGHFEQVKTGGKWKCVSCGRLLTIPESMQNSIELSDVIRSAAATGRPLAETMDDFSGQKEWGRILTGIHSKRAAEKHRG